MKDQKLIADVAAKIREQYILRRNIHANVIKESAGITENFVHQRWDGGIDHRGVRHKPIWPKLAEMAINSAIDPANWVDALFTNAFAFDHIPWPSDLLNKEILKDAVGWSKKLADGAQDRIRTEMLNLEKGCWLMSQFAADFAVDGIRSVIVDPRTDCSVLSRYIFAVENKFDDLIAVFEPAALTQFSAAPDAYRNVLGKRLPTKILQLFEEMKNERRV